MCANERRAAGRRAVVPGASAADWVPELVAQMVANLTSPGVGLQARRPASVDRCLWRCPDCGYQWEATITNRVTKNSGCPRCAVNRLAAARRVPRPGETLADTHPQVAEQLITNETHPGRMASDMPAGANDLCRWRCSRGHEWTTTVAARTVMGSGCRRCGGFGRSRFELEVAELLHVGCGVDVEADVEVMGGGRRWRVDLYVPDIGLYIDLDPAQWHKDQARDTRKVAALSELDYLRVRPKALREMGGQVCLVAGSESIDPVVWAAAIGCWLADRKLPWQEPSAEAVALALARVARTWIDFENGKPQTSALDAAPHLADDFVENLTRPGIGLDWLTPHVPDRIRWKCASCAWVWDAVVSSRAGQETGCPKCASKRLGHERSHAQPEQSLATLHPDLAEEFVGCIPHPERTVSQLKPSSNYLCAWRCRTCAHNWKASPGTRLRGRGCPVCARERARLSRTIAPADESLLALNPDLAREFVACLDEPDRAPVDLLPKSNKACQWRCSTCGHEWPAKVATRAAGNGCPQCGRARTAQARASAPPGGSLLDLFPQLALEAVENLDRPERDPHALRPGSHNRCQWRCATCSHSWVTSVKNRAIHGTRCPACVRAQLRSTDAGKP